MALPAIVAALLPVAFWEIGKACIRFFIGASVGVATYALTKFVLLPIFTGWVQPAIPEMFMCAGAELNLDACVSVILSAYTTRITIISIKWGAKSAN